MVLAALKAIEIATNHWFAGFYIFDIYVLGGGDPPRAPNRSHLRGSPTLAVGDRGPHRDRSLSHRNMASATPGHRALTGHINQKRAIPRPVELNAGTVSDMTNAPSDIRSAAIESGRELQAILEAHIALLVTESDQDDAAVEVDRQLWEAVGAYGEALDELYDDEHEDESDQQELTFTVRTRYDYTIIDEKAFLADGTGIGAAVSALLERAGGKPISALEVASLETGSGLLTVHLNDELLVSDDFQNADEETDLLLIAPNEVLQYVLDEPVYDSRADAEAAAKLRE